MYQSPPPIRTPSVGWMLANLVWRMTLYGGGYGTGAGAAYGLVAGFILNFEPLMGMFAGLLIGTGAGLGLGFWNGCLIGAIAWRWFRPLSDPGRFRVVASAVSAASPALVGALFSVFPLREIAAGTYESIPLWLALIVGPAVVGCGLAWRAAGKASAWYERFCATGPRQ